MYVCVCVGIPWCGDRHEEKERISLLTGRWQFLWEIILPFLRISFWSLAAARSASVRTILSCRSLT